jgi:hypothetical protein
MSQPQVIETSSKEDKELIAKYEEVMAEKERLIHENKIRIEELESEVEGNKAMMECTMADIQNQTDRVEKHSKFA